MLSSVQQRTLHVLRNTLYIIHTMCTVKKVKAVLFSGEGPRSRRYGCTAALKDLVQPCDEDDDDYFLSFS
jgi:hypothetical protein